MGVAIDETHESLQHSSNLMSLDAPVKEGEAGRLEDVLEDRSVESPYQAAAAFTLREEKRGILGTFEDREEKVVRLYNGIGLATAYTLEEIAQRSSLTRERVRQFKERALKRLRHPSRMQKPERFKA